MTKYTPKTKPFPHQARASIRAARKKNYAVFFEPRLGKTKAALDAVGMLSMRYPGLKVCVLCPAIAKEVWADQIEQHFPHMALIETFDEEWTSAGNTDYITHFFIAGREETFRRTRVKGKKRYLRPKQETIEEWNPDLIIIDESHEYQRPGGVAAQDCWKLVRRLRARKKT
jgi:hypothetical protein